MSIKERERKWKNPRELNQKRVKRKPHWKKERYRDGEMERVSEKVSVKEREIVCLSKRES